MTSIVAAFVGLFVMSAIGPFLARAAVRLLHRVPALGAIATLGLFFAFADADAGAPGAQDTLAAPSIFQASTSQSVGWSPDHPRQRTTTDEEMASVYRSERGRYLAEIESVKQAVAEFLER
ncbi:MAG: hypothetical protein CL927_08635 [Deltaproteobacteria bacterium]|nr:hypothetical protein [Deltaproteobacteria bacterium]HCH64796.1 hypothetical protein [Deltaproteobacteria bacterium]